MAVPSPGALVTSSVPPTAAIRSSRPRSPEPEPGSAPPRPSSTTATSTTPSGSPIETETRCASAYFAQFVSASAMVK